MSETMTKEEIAEIVTNSVGTVVDSKLKEFGEGVDEKLSKMEERADKVDNKLLGDAEASEEVSKLEGKARLIKQFKAERQKDTATLKALNTTTLPTGGHLLDEDMQKEVLRITEEHGIVRRYATIISTKRQSMRIPTSPDAIVINWEGEGDQIAETTMTFGNVNVSVKKLAAIMVLTNEMIDDAEIDLLDHVFSVFGEAIALEEDKQGLTGTGAPFVGVLNAPNTNIVIGGASMADTNSDHCRSMISAVSRSSRRSGMFCFSEDVFAGLQMQKGTDGHYIAVQTNINMTISEDLVLGKIWNYPCLDGSDILPAVSETATALKYGFFGNLKNLIMLDRKTVAYTMSDQATVGGVNLYENDMTAIRMIERVGFVVALGATFSVLRTQ